MTAALGSIGKSGMECPATAKTKNADQRFFSQTCTQPKRRGQNLLS
jgi:hypothetical protein